MSDNKLIKIGITQGDVNGIGYEIILKTLADAGILELCTPVIYGSSKVVAYHRKAMELPLVNLNVIQNAQEAGCNKVNIINCVNEEVKVELSVATEEAGKAAFMALERAVADLNEGSIDVLVTAPINSQTIVSGSAKFVGQSHYLEGRLGKEKASLDIFVNDTLRIALATGNIALADVAGELSSDLLIKKLREFNQSLQVDFGIRKPRIAVLSLNPHGDKAETDIIIPAMEAADKDGVLCFGPYPSDDFFGQGTFERFDGVLAMYYDQGLIPFKTLAMESGVNFIAGLSAVCTAPNHGVAYDIAGKNLASEESFRHALFLAIDIYRNRKMDKEINVNPLRKQYFEKGNDNEKLDLTKE